MAVSSFLFYVARDDGSVTGPHVIGALRRELDAGTLSLDSQVCVSGTQDWLPLHEWKTEIYPPPPQNAQPVARPIETPPSNEVAYLALIVPLIAIAVMLFLPVFVVGFFSIGTVVLTSILIAVDASQIKIDKPINGKQGTSPLVWLLLCLLMWFIGFPAYMSSRSRVGAKSLGALGLLVMLIFVGFLFLTAGIEGS